MKVLKLILPLSFLCTTLPCSAGLNIADSLSELIKTAKHDTVTLRLLVELSEVCDEKDIETYSRKAILLANTLLNSTDTKLERNGIRLKKALALNNLGYSYQQFDKIADALDSYMQSLKIFEELENRQEIVGALYNIGFIQLQQGKTEDAFRSYERSLKIQEENGDRKGIAISLSYIGNIYRNQGLIKKSLEYYSKSLKLREEINDHNGIASALNNIAGIYQQLGQMEDAVNFFTKSLNLHKNRNDKKGMAISLGNLGNVLLQQKKFSQALQFYESALRIHEESGNSVGMALLLNNIGNLYLRKGELKRAEEYLTKGLMLNEQTNDKRVISFSLLRIGEIHFLQENYTEAGAFALRARQVALESGNVENLRDIEWLRFQIDSARGQWKQALDNFTHFIIYRDSIANKENERVAMQTQLTYEYEKKEAVLKEQQEKEKVVLEEKQRNQSIVIYAAGTGTLLTLVFAGFVLRSLRTTRRQKRMIEEKNAETEKQKIIIQERNKDITDSISYAARIQRSLQPGEKYIEKHMQRLSRYAD